MDKSLQQPDDRHALIRSEQIRSTVRELPMTIVAVLVGGSLFIYGLSDGSPKFVHFAWLAVLYCSYLPNWVIHRKFQARELNTGSLLTLERPLVWATTFNGIAWGSAGILLYPPDLAHQSLLLLALFFVALTSVASINCFLPQVYALIVPVLTPVAVRVGMELDIVHFILTITVVLMGAFLILSGHNFARIMKASIGMRYENAALNQALVERQVQERTHALEIANQHKSEFLASMSHELRTPLNSIIGFSELLKSGLVGELGEKQARYASHIFTSGHHLLSLINDVLDLSKVESGRMEVIRENFSVRNAVENAAQLVRERATRVDVRLETKLDANLGAFCGDERKVRQILLNLLSNAIKFTPPGGQVTLEARVTHEGVELEVNDTGIGIAPGDQETIFEAFRQLGNDYTRKTEGTGLGLALTKKFVELHGGHIRVISDMGKGSRFIVSLPAPNTSLSIPH